MPTITVSLTASQAVRRWRRRKQGIFGHYNNSGPTGDALEVIHILEKVPGTPGALRLSGTVALHSGGQGRSVGLKNVPAGKMGEGAGAMDH